MMAGRKKGCKWKDKLHGLAVKVVQLDTGAGGKTDEEKEREKEERGEKALVSASENRDARASFGEHAMVIMDHLLKDNLVNEVLKLGPREEMLGLTALSMTASLGHVEGSRRLLEAGASVDDKSSDGSTALLNAVHWRHLPVLDLLLQHGANVTASNNDGDNALMVAVRHGDARAINSLWPHRKNLDINNVNNEGCTALHLAAQRKWESCVQFLIQKGADVNRQNTSGQTALHIAAINGDDATAERLIAAGTSLLLEDKNGNTPFCLAAEGEHDYLAGYLLSKLRPEDKHFFCKRRIAKIQSQLASGDYVLPALFFLTSDLSLRDTLHQCDFIGAMVQVLRRRELTRESTIPSCHVCCNLMHNALSVPDERFVQQFLAARGPETILDRLENRGFDQGLSKEVGYGPGQELRVEVYRTLLLLPVLALVETEAGREWLAANQQRLTAHLRCLTCYHELLQRVSEVKLELCGKEIKLDRSSTVERFLAFFKTLETQDHEEKVRELLELEEREKSRKERKREKKRQQRIKQKMKARAADGVAEKYGLVGAGAGEGSGGKARLLDALDDIPLTVGPDGVQDVTETAVAAALTPRPGSDPRDSEDEWVMVGGKRTYPLKLRLAGLPADLESRQNKESQQAECRSARSAETLAGSLAHNAHKGSTDDSRAQQSLVQEDDTASSDYRLSQTHASDYASSDNDAELQLLEDCHIMAAGGSQKYSLTEDGMGSRGKGGGGGGVRWADVARYGGPSLHPETLSARASPAAHAEQAHEGQPQQEAETCSRRESYKDEFPPLADKDARNQQEDREDENQLMQTDAAAAATAPCGGLSFGAFGHSDRVMEAFYGRAEAMAQFPGSLVRQSAVASAFASAKTDSSGVDPTVLYEALSEWMWQSALAQGLFASDPQTLANLPVDFLCASSQNASKVAPGPPLNTDCCAESSREKSVENDPFGSHSLFAWKPSTWLNTPANIRQAAMRGQQQAGWPEKSRHDLTQHNTPTVDPASACSNRSLFKTLQDERSAQSASAVLSMYAQDAARNNQVKQVPSAEILCADALSRSQGQTTTKRSAEEGFMELGRSAFDDSFTQSSKAGELWRSASDTDRSRRPLGTSRLAEWTATQPRSAAPSFQDAQLVSGKPVPDSNDLYGLSSAAGVLETPRTADFTSWKDLERKEQPYAASLASIVAPVNRYDLKPMPGYAGCNFYDLASKEKLAEQRFDNTKGLPVSERWDDVSSFDLQDTKPKAKSVVVSVARSDSDSQQNSPTEHRSEINPDDINSPTPDSSSSYCLNGFDGFRQVSPHASSTSSATGLQECLAPGFLRAAVGNPQAYNYDKSKYSNLVDNSSVFQGIYGNIGLLPAGQCLSGERLHVMNEPGAGSQYPDLSTIPERDFSQEMRTRMPKPWLAVGHGRPQRVAAASQERDSDSFMHMFDWTRATGDGPVTGTSEEATRSRMASDVLTSAPSSSDAGPTGRPDSPLVLFPETLRDDDLSEKPRVDVFPSIHDMSECDLFQGVFSNSYFLEQIAIDQIRRRLRAMGGDHLLKNSVLFHDLDYYASLYGVRLRDVLGPQDEPRPSSSETMSSKKNTPRPPSGWRALVKELGSRHTERGSTYQADVPGVDGSDDTGDEPIVNDWPWNSKVAPPRIVSWAEGVEEEGWWQEGAGSRRWRTWLRQILDMPWTMRRQYGKIVLPARSMEFNIGRTGSHPLVLGFLTDGAEVGVLALDRTRHALDTRLMATVAADSKSDVHFVLRYKAVWECAGRVYLAMELCDYTLDEYVGIVRLDHRQDPLSANRLAWQMLKGLKYLHSNFAVPHGNLMPGWIFVDGDGRLRLAGYGLRDVISSLRGGARDFPDKMTSLGDGRFWRATEHMAGTQTEPCFQADIQVAGMLLHYILTGGCHPYGDSAMEVEGNLRHNSPRPAHVSQEADHLVSAMIMSDPDSRPSIDACLKHPFFWSGEKRFRLVLIVGSDILTEMKTCVPLTGPGSASMVDILNVVHINAVSDNWLGEVDPVVVKEMRAFRQYKNTLPELVLFVYNCCLHFDKMSTVAKEVLDDPCKYFQTKFPALFMAVYRAMRASDRTDRTCYKPFF